MGKYIFVKVIPESNVMKKLVLLSFLVLTLCISGCEKIIENVENKIQITDKIHKAVTINGGFKNCTVYCTKYTYNNGRLVNKAKHKWNYIKYDEKGNILEKIYFDGPQDSIIDFRETNKYDEKGNTIEENQFLSYDIFLITLIFKYDKRDSLIEHVRIYFDEYDKGSPIKKDSTFYKYNIKGNKIEEIIYKCDSLYQTINYKYDTKGNKIEDIKFDNNQNIIEKRIYKNNNNGKVLEEVCLGANQNILEKRLYNYKDYGKKTELSVYGSKGFISIRYFRTYDLNGYTDDQFDYDETGTKTHIYQIKYNLNGDRIEENVEYQGEGNKKNHFKTLYVYNKKGNLDQELYYYLLNKILYTQNYKYDNYGNLIEKLTYDEYNQLSSKTEYIYSK